MATKKGGLGKGLGGLFNANNVTEEALEHTKSVTKKARDTEQVEKLLLDQIVANPFQPRHHFDEEKLNELAKSIQSSGVLTPIIVRRAGQQYQIIAGERRVRASKLAGLTTISAIVRTVDDDTMAAVALIENLQRDDLDAIEEAQAYQTMMEKLKLTQNELAKRIGKSRTHITNTLRLLNLPEKIQEYVLDGSLSMGHARALITLDKERALKIAKRVIDEKLSVRDVENIVKGFELQEARKNKPKVEKSKEYQYVEGLLRKKYRTRIKVDDKSITIKYSDTDDLNRLLELMGVIEES